MGKKNLPGIGNNKGAGSACLPGIGNNKGAGSACFPGIGNRAFEIEQEFAEPLRDVVAGFVPLGLTRVEVAETLEVSPRSLRSYCDRTGIRFPRNQPGHRERIRGSRNGRARVLELDGERHCISEWARMNGLHPNTVIKRMSRGKSLRQALA